MSGTGSLKFVINTNCPQELKNNLLSKLAEKNLPACEGFIEYDDANSLYSWTMRHKLPVGGFHKISDDQFIDEHEEIIKTHKLRCSKHVNMNDSCDACKNSILNLDESYLIECDIEYPEELHDKHNDLPLAPENIIITPNMLSAKQRENKLDKGTRLTPNFRNKKHYILFFENFVAYQLLGLNVTKIRRVVKFRQEAWMKKFIDFNLEMRKKYPKIGDLFKTANNSVFGKTMENVRKYRKVKFISDPVKVKKIARSPYYCDVEIIDKQGYVNGVWNEGIVMIERKNKKVKLNKPIYCGMKILDLSKFHMYDVWYNVLKPVFGDNLVLILMDTDSFVFAILGMDEETYNNTILKNPLLRDYFDFSKFPEDHPLYIKSNTDCGKMKSERQGGLINFAVSLRSKMYYLDLPTRKKADIAKLKGVTKAFKEKLITGEYYIDSLLGKTYYVQNQTRFQVIDHKMHTIQENKKALSAADCKRYITENPCITRAIGHYKNNTN
jgi:hypothetical protein